MKFFIKKINDIKKEYDDERLKKAKKYEDFLEKENQLMSELEWIKNIAQKIDNENHSLIKKYMDLKHSYQTQENDRDLLLKELILKKKKNSILKSQIQQYKTLLNEMSQNQENEDEQLQIEEFNDQNRQDSGKSQSMTSNLKDAHSQKESDLMTKAYERLQRYESVIKSLQNNLRKEQKRLRDLKNAYIKEVESKSEIEKIIRQTIQDIRDETNQVKAETRNSLKKKEDEFDKNDRFKLIEKLLTTEKIISLVYDKTFHNEFKLLGEIAQETTKQSQGDII